MLPEIASGGDGGDPDDLYDELHDLLGLALSLVMSTGFMGRDRQLARNQE